MTTPADGITVVLHVSAVATARADQTVGAPSAATASTASTAAGHGSMTHSAETALKSWLTAARGWNRPVELIVAADGAPTALVSDLVRAAEKEFPTQRVVNESAKGFGTCLRSAFAVSSQPLFFYSTLDEAYHPADLAGFFPSLALINDLTNRPVEVVNGHRRGSAVPADRLLRHRAYATMMRLLFGFSPEPPKSWLGPDYEKFRRRCRRWFGIRVGDISSRFKLFRRSALERIEIQSTGEFVHAELLAKCNFLGCTIDELLLTDRTEASGPGDTLLDERRVFKNPKFRSAIPTPAESAPSALAPV